MACMLAVLALCSGVVATRGLSVATVSSAPSHSLSFNDQHVHRAGSTY